MAKALLATAVIGAIIICLSLYPFYFRVPSPQIGPVATLLASLHRRPPLRDFLANIVGYLPFGFFFRRGFRQNLDPTGRTDFDRAGRDHALAFYGAGAVLR